MTYQVYLGANDPNPIHDPNSSSLAIKPINVSNVPVTTTPSTLGTSTTSMANIPYIYWLMGAGGIFIIFLLGSKLISKATSKR